jgi:hypothetical protein
MIAGQKVVGQSVVVVPGEAHVTSRACRDIVWYLLRLYSWSLSRNLSKDDIFQRDFYLVLTKYPQGTNLLSQLSSKSNLRKSSQRGTETFNESPKQKIVHEHGIFSARNLGSFGRDHLVLISSSFWIRPQGLMSPTLNRKGIKEWNKYLMGQCDAVV